MVRPPGAGTGILLARADGEAQAAAVGRQVAGRVGFFLRVEDFQTTYDRLVAAGVEFARGPRMERYGRVAVFLDVAGNGGIWSARAGVNHVPKFSVTERLTSWPVAIHSYPPASSP